VVTKEQFLTNGEKIVLRTKTHIINLIIPAIVLLASFIFLYDSFWLFLSIFTVALIYLIIATYQYTYFEYIITNKRFIKRSGFYYVRFQEIPLKKINNITFWQSWSGKIKGTGTITLFRKSMPKKVIKDLAKAKKFRGALYSQLPPARERLVD